MIYKTNIVGNQTLNSIEIDPPSLTTEKNITHTLYVRYNPDDYSDKQGYWTYPQEITKLYGDYDMFIFSATTDGQYDITYTDTSEAANPVTPATATITVKEDSVISMVLIPEYQSVTHDTSTVIDIEILPNPPQADISGGVWKYDNKILSLVSQNGNTATFNILNTSPNFISTDVYYQLNDVMSSPSTVIITDVPATSVKIDPDTTPGVCGKQIYLRPTVSPYGSGNVGKWVYDPNYFNLDTPNQVIGQFTVLRGSSDGKPLDISFYANEDVFGTCVVDPITYQPIRQIKLHPNMTEVEAGNGFYIDIEYLPQFSEPGGKWSFQPEGYIETFDLNSTDYRQYFTAIKPSDVPIMVTFESNTDAQVYSWVGIIVDYTQLHGIDILYNNVYDPDAEILVSAGDQFELDIQYLPDTANHDSTWEEFDETIFRLDSFDNEKALFTVLKESDDMQFLTIYGGNEISDTIKVRTKYADLETLTFLDHDTQTLSATNDDLFIDITYNPDVASHEGGWSATDGDGGKLNYKTFLKEMPDSTHERAHFKTKGIQTVVGGNTLVPSGGFNLIYTSTANPDVNGDPISDQVRVVIGYDPLTGVILTPPSQSINVGDEVDIYIIQSPTTSQLFNDPNGWIFDKNTFEIDYTNYANNRITLKSLKATTDETKNISYNPNRVGVKPASTIVEVAAIPLTEINISTDETSVPIGAIFLITAEYVPDTAVHNGVWSYDKSIFSLDEGRSNPDYGVFSAIAGTNAAGSIITLSSGDISDSEHFNVRYSNISDVVLNPLGGTTKYVNQDAYIEIIYEPNTAEHFGGWVYDEEYFEYMADSTFDLAHFRPLKVTDSGGSTLTYYAKVQLPGQPAPHKSVNFIINKG